jgi:rhomboid family GlyGly-CTERM serine protease
MAADDRPGRGARWRTALNLQGRRPLALAAGLLLLLLPLWGGDALRVLWRYERARVAAGEVWRLVSCHLVHLDPGHALLNAAGLCLLWILLADIGTRRFWLQTSFLSMLAIGCGFWWLMPGLAWYVGASGLLHGFMAAGIVELLRRRERIALPAAVLLAAKLAWEQGVGPLPLETRGTVIVAAHLFGAAGGLLAAFLPAGRRGAILRATYPQDGR